MERLRDVGAAERESNSRVRERNTIFDAADGRLLVTDVHHTRVTNASSKSSSYVILHWKTRLVLEIPIFASVYEHFTNLD